MIVIYTLENSRLEIDNSKEIILDKYFIQQKKMSLYWVLNKYRVSQGGFVFGNIQDELFFVPKPIYLTIETVLQQNKINNVVESVLK